VHHDGSLLRAVVHAWLEAEQAERAAVAADVGPERDEETEARLQASGLVGEALGEVLPARAPVGDELLVAQGALREVEHEQPGLARRPRVVDHRERVAVRQQPAALRARGSAQREAQHAAVERRGGGGERLEGARVGCGGRRRAGGDDSQHGPRERAGEGAPASLRFPEHPRSGSEAPVRPP